MGEIVPIGGDFTGKSFISVDQLARPDTDALLEQDDAARAALGREKKLGLLRGVVVVNLFYDSSTRTSSSFELAAKRLSADTMSIRSSRTVADPEALDQTLAELPHYMDENGILVLRHPDQAQVERAAQTFDYPVINAGSRNGEHPTAALTDFSVLAANAKVLDGLKIAMVGDFSDERVTQPLVRLVGQYDDLRITYLSPADELSPTAIWEEMDKKGVNQRESRRVAREFETSHAIYLGEIPASLAADEWLSGQGLKDYYGYRYMADRRVYRPSQGNIIFTAKGQSRGRVNKGFAGNDEEQIRHGLVTKMALLSLIAGKHIQA